MIKEVTFYYPKDIAKTEETYRLRTLNDFIHLSSFIYRRNIVKETKDYKMGKCIIRVKISWFNSKKFDNFLEKEYSKTKIVYTIKNIYGGNI